jgi:hypothetical protein
MMLAVISKYVWTPSEDFPGMEIGQPSCDLPSNYFGADKNLFCTTPRNFRCLVRKV